MSHVNSCGRCGAKIVEHHHSDRPMEFFRKRADKTHETNQIRLCSMCLDDVWEFVFDEDIDRSNKADPISISRMEKSVERHIEDLENVIEMLSDKRPNVDMDELPDGGGVEQ